MKLKKQILIALILTIILELILFLYEYMKGGALCKMCDPTLIACPSCPTGFDFAITSVGLTIIPLFLIILLILYLIDKFKRRK